jgi:nitroreductase
MFPINHTENGDRDGMDLERAIRARRMCRRFLDTPIDPTELDRLLDLARRVPSAGYSQGFHFLVLNGADQTKIFWDHTLPSDERDRFPWPTLIAAPVIVLPLADANAYVRRYSEPDKAKTGLGESAAAWPVPYWWGDTAMAVQNLLLAVTDCGLGALYFGIFRAEAELLATLGVPEGVRPLGAVALGHPAPDAYASKEGSARTRARNAFDEVVHRGHW